MMKEMEISDTINNPSENVKFSTKKLPFVRGHIQLRHMEFGEKKQGRFVNRPCFILTNVSSYFITTMRRDIDLPSASRR